MRNWLNSMFQAPSFWLFFGVIFVGPSFISLFGCASTSAPRTFLNRIPSQQTGSPTEKSSNSLSFAQIEKGLIPKIVAEARSTYQKDFAAGAKSPADKRSRDFLKGLGVNPNWRHWTFMTPEMFFLSYASQSSWTNSFGQDQARLDLKRAYLGSFAIPRIVEGLFPRAELNSDSELGHGLVEGVESNSTPSGDTQFFSVYLFNYSDNPWYSFDNAARPYASLVGFANPLLKNQFSSRSPLPFRPNFYFVYASGIPDASFESGFAPEDIQLILETTLVRHTVGHLSIFAENRLLNKLGAYPYMQAKRRDITTALTGAFGQWLTTQVLGEDSAFRGRGSGETTYVPGKPKPWGAARKYSSVSYRETSRVWAETRKASPGPLSSANLYGFFSLEEKENSYQGDLIDFGWLFVDFLIRGEAEQVGTSGKKVKAPTLPLFRSWLKELKIYFESHKDMGANPWTLEFSDFMKLSFLWTFKDLLVSPEGVNDHPIERISEIFEEYQSNWNPVSPNSYAQQMKAPALAKNSFNKKIDAAFMGFGMSFETHLVNWGYKIYSEVSTPAKIKPLFDRELFTLPVQKKKKN